jgi:hypothetical protein
MKLTLWCDATTEDGTIIPMDSKVEYRGHVIGGMLSVLAVIDGKEIRAVIHPENTVELRTTKNRKRN